MNNRELELIKLKEYIDHVDKETTLLLQNLQWNYKHLLQSPAMVSCKHVAGHRVPLHSLETHEKQCYLMQEGYHKEDVLLPDPVYSNADTIVKFGKQDILKIINTAASMDPSFKRGSGAAEPLSVERLQQAYSADERRTIHDAVVAAAPACHDLADLALASSSSASGPHASKVKSRAEILAELRDMKRRRARYRVAAKTTNYSDVLRDVIKTQMELYAEAKRIFIKTEYGSKSYVSLKESSERDSINIVIKQERISPDSDSYSHKGRTRSTDRKWQRTDNLERAIRNDKKCRDHYENSSDKRKYKDSSEEKYSKDRRRYEDGYTRRDTYNRNKDTREGSHRHDSSTTDEPSTSKHVGRYIENERKLSKYENRNHNNYSKNASKYESSSKELDKHRSYREYREDSSKNSKYEHRRKYDEYQRSHKDDRYREEKHRRHHDVEIKEEVDY